MRWGHAIVVLATENATVTECVLAPVQVASGTGTADAYMSWRGGRWPLGAHCCTGASSPSSDAEITKDDEKGIARLPGQAWETSLNRGGSERGGCFVAELAGLNTRDGWIEGMRLIVRRVRPSGGHLKDLTAFEKETGGRTLSLQPCEVQEVLDHARLQHGDEQWRAKSRTRAGVEGTIHQAVAVTGIRRARYLGLQKTHLEHVFAAVTLNLIRLDAWWNGTPAGPHSHQPPCPPQPFPRRVTEQASRNATSHKRRRSVRAGAPPLTCSRPLR
ncbi:transposase [Streptomyces griseoflavus]|uniref:transposase n=1 Tax=Streptomyces griseoflavus TaxID=35619 RepID=UPI003D730A83